MPDRFDWDDDNESHVLEHGLDPYDVEDAFYNQHISTPAYNQDGERRYGLIGATDGERIITVIYTYRDGRIRVVTARDADKSEKARYKHS